MNHEHEWANLRPEPLPVKVELARRLRRETTVSVKWIAQELGVGSWKHLSNLLSQPASEG